MNLESIIGLEVHAELLTQSKMFCGCAVVDSTIAEPNSSVCEICTGMPGTLPVINRRAVEYALRVALALNCSVAETSVFARKNYFYPDLPKGFQISQYELPLARSGWLSIDTEAGPKRIGVRRVHLEEDTGKLIHREDHSLVDYNRSGIPLLEIVSEPDMRSVEEVRVYSTSLRSLLRYLEVNSGDMQKGVIRFEANVSLRPVGSQELGTRTEIKNLNSFRAVSRSVEYELNRQRKLLLAGKEVQQETVGWDENREITLPQRQKEGEDDYRYFPEPDLPPLTVSRTWVNEIRASLPELPAAKQARFEREYSLSPYAAALLTADRPLADYYEAAAAAAQDVSAEKIANWTTGTLFALLNEAGLEIEDSPVSASALAELVQLVETRQLSAANGKEVLEEIFQHGGSPSSIVKEKGLAQLSDPTEIRTLVEDVLQEHPDQLADYLAGKRTIAEWFVGQVMRKTRGKANPAVVRAALEEVLQGLDENPTPESR